MSQEEKMDQENVVSTLKEEPNFLAVQYNQKMKAQKPQRAGGVYVPPHKLRAMQEKMLEEEDATSVNYQRLMWELLRKSINGIINKVNISNIQNIVIELFNENILRGMGLLARAIIKAQMSSPNFTHVYAALIAVINTKLPQIGNLIITRVMILFKRSFHRNNKIVCIATTKMLAHLINQRILGQFIGLQILMMMLMNPTDDKVEIACDFMIEVGQVLSQITPKGANVVFQRFKSLLHQGQINQKAQYSIQNLFAIRKTGFKDHPGVIPELDLVELQDQITHQMDFEEDLSGKENLNVFREDKQYAKTQAEWDQIKQQILGEENIINLKQMKNYEAQIQQYQDENEDKGIKDLTEQDLINLRRTIYLAIQSTVNFEECAHKILKMNIAKGYQMELVDMILQCCMMERIYQDFFGLLAQRFCKINDLYKELFIQAFVKHYNAIFKQQANKIRNLGEIFGHLFYSHSIDWKIFEIVTLRQDTTTAAHRMFLKILFRKIAEHMGIDSMAQEFANEQMRQYYMGLFPIGHPNDVRFAINYFTSIGLGKLTQEMREVLEIQEDMIAERKQKEEQQKLRRLMEEEEEMLKLQQLERERQKKELEMKMKEAQRKVQRKKILDQKYKKKVSQSSSEYSSSSSSQTPKKAQKRMRKASQSSEIYSSSEEGSSSSSQTPEVKRPQKRRNYSQSSQSDSNSSSPSHRHNRSRQKRRYKERKERRYRSSSSDDKRRHRRRRN